MSNTRPLHGPFPNGDDRETTPEPGTTILAMRTSWRGRARVLAWVFGTDLVLAVPVVPTFLSDASTSRPLSLTGEYQLYCPDPVETPIVLHLRATATIAPVAAPAPKRLFSISGFQTEVTFPQGVASALAQMSPMTGRVTGTVLVLGASPHSRPVADSNLSLPSSRPRYPPPGLTSGCRSTGPSSVLSRQAPTSSPSRRQAGSS